MNEINKLKTETDDLISKLEVHFSTFALFLNLK